MKVPSPAEVRGWEEQSGMTLVTRVINFIAVSFTGEITVRLSLICLLLPLEGPGLP